jgi:hypothetical protein
MICLFKLLAFLFLQVVPGTLEYVVESQCGCTASELLRMERIILNKLQWDLRDVTALDFLHIVSTCAHAVGGVMSCHVIVSGGLNKQCSICIISVSDSETFG